MHEVPIEGDRPRVRSFAPPMSGTVAVSLLVAIDTVAILASGYLTYDTLIVYSADIGVYLFAVTFIWLVTLSLLNFGSLYLFEAAINPFGLIGPIVGSVAIAFLFFLAAAFSLKFSETLSRAWVTVFALSTVVSLVFLRALLALVLRRLVKLESFQRNLAILGEGVQVERFLTALMEVHNRPVRVSGIYSPDLACSGCADDTEGTQVADFSSLVEQARLGQIDDVAIALPWSEDDAIMQCVARLRELPVNVYLVSDLVGFRTRLRTAPTHFGALPVTQVVSKPMAGWDSVIKAAEDYVIGLAVLVAIAPILLIIALAVRVDSPGPVIFKQRRLGFNNRVFSVYKFRTMHHAPIADQSTVQATAGDPRVTRLGRFLRRTSLDELPQIFNVLNGSMSIVGPRPHALDHNEEFSRRMSGYFARHRVKPGITGLAQVKGFRGPTDTKESLEGRIRNDIQYAENWSLMLDLQILVRTIGIVISGKNAY